MPLWGILRISQRVFPRLPAEGLDAPPAPEGPSCSKPCPAELVPRHPGGADGGESHCQSPACPVSCCTCECASSARASSRDTLPGPAILDPQLQTEPCCPWHCFSKGALCQLLRGLNSLVQRIFQKS